MFSEQWALQKLRDTDYFPKSLMLHLDLHENSPKGRSGIMRKHAEHCNYSSPITDENVSILAKSNISYKLLTLEALFIYQMKPIINTKDEYRSRTLTLKF